MVIRMETDNEPRAVIKCGPKANTRVGGTGFEPVNLLDVNETLYQLS